MLYLALGSAFLSGVGAGILIMQFFVVRRLTAHILSMRIAGFDPVREPRKKLSWVPAAALTEVNET